VRILDPDLNQGSHGRMPCAFTTELFHYSIFICGVFHLSRHLVYHFSRWCRPLQYPWVLTGHCYIRGCRPLLCPWVQAAAVLAGAGRCCILGFNHLCVRGFSRCCICGCRPLRCLRVQAAAVSVGAGRCCIRGCRPLLYLWVQATAVSARFSQWFVAADKSKATDCQNDP